MAQPLVCRWAIVGLPHSTTARRFLDDVVRPPDGGVFVPIQHEVAVALIEDAQDEEPQRVLGCPNVKVASSLQDLLRSPNLDAVLVASQESPTLPSTSLSNIVYEACRAALLAGKFVLVPRPTSLHLAADHARLLMDLAAQKRQWLGIMVRKRAAGQSAKSGMTAAANAGKRSTLGVGPSQALTRRASSGAFFAANNGRASPSGISSVSSPTSPSSSQTTKATTALTGSSSPPPPPLSPSIPNAPSSLRWAADEAARCRERGIVESNMLAWEENLALLECIEELRQTGGMQRSGTEGSDVSFGRGHVGIDGQSREADPGSDAGAAPTKPTKTVEDDIAIPVAPVPARFDKCVETDAPSSVQASPLLNGDLEPAAESNSITAHQRLPSLPGTPIVVVSDDQNADQPATPVPLQGSKKPLDVAARRFPKTPYASVAALHKEHEADLSTSTSVEDSFELESPVTRRDRTTVRPSSPLARKNSGAGDDALRKENLELKHMVRQQQEHITVLLEQSGRSHPVMSIPAAGRAGSNGSSPRNKSALRVSLPPQPFASSKLPRRRQSSHETMGRNLELAPDEVGPTSGTRSRATATQIPGPRFSQQEAATTIPRETASGASVLQPLQPSAASNSAAGRQTLTRTPRLGEDQEGRSTPPQLKVADDASRFQAPTRASESRRLATLQETSSSSLEGVAIPSSPSLSPSRPVSRHGGDLLPNSNDSVIARLTQEVESTRATLETTRHQLTSSQRNLSSLQRMYDSTKESLASSRVECDRRETALARKEKMLAEALERARRSETEAKELGRSSREWGGRVRTVESELGDVRRSLARAEGAYEALRSAHNSNRSKLEGEVADLRKQLQRTVQTHEKKAREAVERLLEVEERFKGREGQRRGLEAVLEGLAAEREKAQRTVVGCVASLVERVEENEEVRRGQQAMVREVKDELDRLLHLMRRGGDGV